MGCRLRVGAQLGGPVSGGFFLRRATENLSARGLTATLRFVNEFGPNMRSGHGRAIGKNHSYMQQYLSLIGTGRRTSAWRRASRSPSSLGYQNENCGHQDRRVRIIVVLITASDPAHAPVISFGSPHGIDDHKRVGLRGSLRMRVDRRKLSLA